jgi:hypothetical protein
MARLRREPDANRFIGIAAFHVQSGQTVFILISIY